MPEDNATPPAGDNVTPDANGSEGKGAEGAAPAATVADWRTGLDPELRAIPAADKFKTPGELFKSYNELEKLVGDKRDRFVLPNEKSKPEEVRAFFQKLGMPEKPEGYKVPQIEGVELNKNEMTAFLKFAHDNHFTQKNLDALYKFEMDRIVAARKQQDAAMNEKREKSEATLRQEFGRAYDEKINIANKAILVGGEDANGILKDYPGLADDPRMVRWQAKIGASFAESGFHGIEEGGHTMTPDQARQEIHNMYADKKHPFNNPKDPEHKAALERRDSLFKMAYPSMG